MATAPERFDWRPALGVALAVFGFLAFVIPSAPGMGDSAEFTLALVLAGVPHPTGYPAYVLGGHLFVRIVHALGASWVVASALWSAAGAAVACGACVRISQHIATAMDRDGGVSRLSDQALRRWAAVLFPACALALHPVFLGAATIAEVHTWHLATLALAVAFLIGRLRALEPAAGPEGSEPRETPPLAGEVRAAATWGFLCGLCGTQHATALLFVAPMTMTLLLAHIRAKRWHPLLAGAWLTAALVPLASYGWIAWRATHPAPFQWPVGAGVSAFWMHVRGGAYSHFLGGFAPSRAEWSVIRSDLSPWIVSGFVLGSALALWTRSLALRWGILTLLGAGLLQIAFIVSYAVPDPQAYFLPVLFTCLLVATPTLLSLRRFSSWLSPAIAIGLICSLASWSIPRTFAHREELATVEEEFRRAWGSIPFESGIVLWADDHYHRFVLLQQLEGRKPAIYVDNPEMLVWPERRRAFRERFGFDPLEGLHFRSAEDLARIAVNVQRRASVPTIVIPDRSH